MHSLASAALLALSLLASCASHEIRHSADFDDLPAAPANTAVRVLQPEDGSYKDKVTPGSGLLVARRIEQFASQRYSDVAGITAPLSNTTERTLEITPVIHKWEDRATNWSGKCDQIDIELRLRDLPSGKSRKLTFEATCAWFTFVNNPPEDLLDGAFQDALTELLPELR